MNLEASCDRRAAAILALFSLIQVAASAAPFLSVPASEAKQAGNPPRIDSSAHFKILANEPEGRNAGVIIEFDFSAASQTFTPLALLQLGEMEKQKVSRPGRKSSEGRGVLHVFPLDAAGNPGELAGSTPVKPAGIPTPYTIDVTRIVSGCLAKPTEEKRLRLEVRMTGKPAWYEVYALLSASGKSPSRIEIAPSANWTNDWAQRLAPVGAGDVVYREACMPMVSDRGTSAVLNLTFPARRIIDVVHNGTGERLVAGRDFHLDGGKLILSPTSRAPIQLASEFFVTPRKNTDGSTNWIKSQIRLVEGTWYHQRQVEVTYEPENRTWSLPEARSSIKNLPRTQRLLESSKPLTLLLFGDSISLGGNASKFQGGWPYQPAFGELVAWGLERRYQSEVVFMNHSRGGAGAAFGASQAASQAGWFKPDLVIIGYGMNDRSDERRVTYRASLEKIIDTIRQDSPETEFILVTSMLNNPKQPTGLDPILALRDEAFKISRPGLAFVDLTTTHLEILKRKDYLDTSGNGANHPNDFLHRIYAHRILEVLGAENPDLISSVQK